MKELYIYLYNWNIQIFQHNSVKEYINAQFSRITYMCNSHDNRKKGGKKIGKGKKMANNCKFISTWAVQLHIISTWKQADRIFINPSVYVRLFWSKYISSAGFIFYVHITRHVNFVILWLRRRVMWTIQQSWQILKSVWLCL